ncbi:MAG: FAD-dependent oxidoreductase [Planctomycetota bacterium]
MTESISVDVLVLGGGSSGVAAAIQAARSGARTLVCEESPWLGGMLTSAGVSAVDGNEGALGGGIYRELRDHLEGHYGGAEALRTGWVSNVCFEPHVGAQWFAEAAREAGVEVRLGARPLAVHREGECVVGALLVGPEGEVEVRAKITVDATELGDGLALAKIPYRLGRDAHSETGEDHAPQKADDELQDLTWVAILQKFDGKAPAIPRPAGYDPRLFSCSTKEHCHTTDEAVLNHKLHSWDGFLSYGALPKGKFMLNWPFHSNDYPLEVSVVESREERAKAWAAARARTLAFVHYMQNELGHPEIGLAEGQFPASPDGLAYIPYIRESRRMVGAGLVREEEVVPRPGRERPPIQPRSIAVGDYFLDHHHSKAHLPPEERLVENYPSNAPFQVSYDALVPETVDGFLAAEKNLSVSHIANGCTRLQPVSVAIGQAAGAAAALCVEREVEPRALDVALLQQRLISAGCVLTPYRDIDPTHEAFSAMQALALRTDDREPLFFEPDRPLESIEEHAYLCRRWGVELSFEAGESRSALAIRAYRGEPR